MFNESMPVNRAQIRKAHSPYSKFYDASCIYWEADSESNLYFLNKAQRDLNDRLKEEGYLFLNDVYKYLGIKKTKAGQIVGWIYEEENQFGDNFVDFGIYDKDDERCVAFVNGEEDVILLDFNVDGEIISRISNDILPAY